MKLSFTNGIWPKNCVFLMIKNYSIVILNFQNREENVQNIL